MSRRGGALARLRRLIWRALRLALLVLLAWIGAYAWVAPPTTALIETERARLGAVAWTWRPLSEISPHLARAVVAAEDSRFCAHWGFDFDELRKALEGGARRGASTITQQTAKNAFLFPGRSWLRKALEAGFTPLIELIWGKRRILEVYLNIAEMGPGVFGAEAAARRWFGKPAAALTAAESARLAAILPSPRERDPTRPSAFQRRRAAAIRDGAATIRAQDRDACFLRGAAEGGR